MKIKELWPYISNTIMLSFKVMLSYYKTLFLVQLNYSVIFVILKMNFRGFLLWWCS